MALLLPPPVPVDQLAEVGRLLTVLDDELVFEQLFGCGTLHKNGRRLNETEVKLLLNAFCGNITLLCPPGGSRMLQHPHQAQERTKSQPEM